MKSNIARSKWRNARLLSVFLDGTGTAAISGPDAHLFALTDNGTGDYTLTAATAFAEPPYVTCMSLTADIAFSLVAAPTTTVINITSKEVDDAPVAKDADFWVLIYAAMPFSFDSDV